jgi:sodium/hydrogen antiporter
VFGLIAVDSLAPEESRAVLAAVTVTVALSVLLHGVTASPLAARYGEYSSRLGTEFPELSEAPPVSTRSMRTRRTPQGGGGVETG